MKSFRNSIRASLRKILCFSGKASRSEFWQWVLFVFCDCLLLLVVEILFLNFRARTYCREAGNTLVWIGGIVFFIFLLFSAISVLSIGARRLRDAGYRPWTIFIPFLLLIGSYHPALDFTLSGMDDNPPDIPLPLSCGYLAITAVVGLIFIFRLSRKSR